MGRASKSGRRNLVQHLDVVLLLERVTLYCQILLLPARTVIALARGRRHDLHHGPALIVAHQLVLHHERAIDCQIGGIGDGSPLTADQQGGWARPLRLRGFVSLASGGAIGADLRSAVTSGVG